MGREWYFGVYRYLCGSKKSISIMMKALQNRTTIRRYKGDDVSEELLNGCEYSESVLTEKLRNTDLTPYFGNLEKKDFIGMFFK